MTKKNLQAEVTIRVLGKELTQAEAEEVYAALGRALNKPSGIQYIYRDRYPYYTPAYSPPPAIPLPWYTTCSNNLNDTIGQPVSGLTANYAALSHEKLLN